MPLIRGACDLLALARDHWKLGDGGMVERWGSRQASTAKAGIAALTRGQRHSRAAATPGRASLREIADRLAGQDAWALTVDDAEGGYPTRLVDAWGDRAPAVLYGLGDPALLARDAIAIIGTRRPSHAGAAAALAWGKGCARAGWVVASGNAPGIDSSAHAGALSVLAGRTVAYIPTPLDQFKPRVIDALAPPRNRRALNEGGPRFDSAALLASLLAEGRLVVASPFRLGAPVEPWCFLRRNELVAATSGAAIVAETGMTGGTHNTIRHLRALRRPIYVADLPADLSPYRAAHERLVGGGARWAGAQCRANDLGKVVQSAAAALAEADRNSQFQSQHNDLFAGSDE